MHGGGATFYGLDWRALGWLERIVHSGMTTLETGAGASTIVFAASGASHTAISPAAEEHERIAAYCEREQIGLDRVRFIARPSHTVLAGADVSGPLDLVLVDGAHAFPYPSLDWFFAAPHLRPGGWMVLDDAFLPSVNVVARYLQASRSWRQEHVLGRATLCFRKLDDAEPTFDWLECSFDRRPQFDYLPPHRRPLVWARYLLLDRSPLRRVVERRIRERASG